RSYTTFEYANLALSQHEILPNERIRATVDVTNTGGIAGDEVVQLYVSYRGSRVERAPKDLRAFARVHLEPGETRSVPLELGAEDLAYWEGADGRGGGGPVGGESQLGAASPAR